VVNNPYNEEGGLSIEELVSVVQQAGWDEEQIPEAVRIILLESKGNPKAVELGGNKNGYGLFQVDLGVHWDKTAPNTEMRKWFEDKGVKNRKDAVEWLKDPLNNAQAALQIWSDRDAWDTSDSGWEAWSTWNGGKIPKGRSNDDWDKASLEYESTMNLLVSEEKDVEKEIIEEPVTIYLNGKPSLVDPKIADTIVNNTDYSYESGSSQLTEDNIQNISQSPTEDFMRTEQQQALELKNMTPRKQKLSDNFAKLLQATVRAE